MLAVVGVTVVIAVLVMVAFKIDCVLLAGAAVVVVIDDTVVVSFSNGILKIFGLIVVVVDVEFNSLLSFAFEIVVVVVAAAVVTAELCKG